MTAKKAIEIIQEYVKLNTIVNDQDFIAALKLGIEALDREMIRRRYVHQLPPDPLPGETIDE